MLTEKLEGFCEGISNTTWKDVDTYGKTWKGGDAVLYNLLPDESLRITRW